MPNNNNYNNNYNNYTTGSQQPTDRSTTSTETKV